MLLTLPSTPDVPPALLLSHNPVQPTDPAHFSELEGTRTRKLLAEEAGLLLLLAGSVDALVSRCTKKPWVVVKLLIVKDFSASSSSSSVSCGIIILVPA